MRSVWARGAVVFVVVFAAALIFSEYHPAWLVGEWWRTQTTLTLGGEHIVAEVRDTPRARTQGLSGRDFLEEGKGMLFVFPVDGYYSFWMKDMKFPIDIVWISKDGSVVDIQNEVSPETYPEYSFAPQDTARYVLELRAGFVKEHGVSVGSVVEF